tara:strand:- start:586 stop:798 length:213 start_codon:yes stop_codon:yes gene_type:complete
MLALKNSKPLSNYGQMTEEQKDFLFRHPWFLKLFPREDRLKIIASYTREQQETMIARYDLELKYGKFKKK